MYIAIVTEYSNGLDSSNINFTFHSKEQAIADTRNLIKEKRAYYTSIGGDILVDTECHFRADENNMKGNGFELIIVEEDVMMESIVSHTENSKNMYELETIGDDCVPSVQEVPVLNLPSSLPYTGWSYDEPDAYYYKPLYIVARPHKYDPMLDNQDEYTTIYDVYMNRVHMDDMHNPDVKTDDVAVVYVDSLECVGYDILCNIYSHLES